MTSDIVLSLLIFVAALLYSSVGHAGASGYLAAMALVGIAPSVMKPTALSLNILVAAIATWKFYRARCFSWPLFWPFALTSVPMAFVGGMITLPGGIYKPIVGVVLLFAAYRLLFKGQRGGTVKAPPVVAALAIGAAIGLLSGLTGVGGGIFLTPLLLIMGWSETRQSSGVSAAFILVNSIAGLAGHSAGLAALPSNIMWLALSAGLGGWIGAEYGSRRFDKIMLCRVLALVLTIAGVKMIFVH